MTSEWQPIESTPKDGRWFLVHMKGYSIPAYGRWVTGDELSIVVSVDVHGRSMTAAMGTHWMPLPAPPKENDHA